jgi:hypothetical protein
MTEFAILGMDGDPQRWLVDIQRQTVSEFDPENIYSADGGGEAGIFCRSEAASQSYSVNCRSEAASQSYSVNCRSEAASQSYSVNCRSEAASQTYSVNCRSEAASHSYSYGA